MILVKVLIWGRNKKVVREINRRQNRRYLKGIDEQLLEYSSELELFVVGKVVSMKFHVFQQMEFLVHYDRSQLNLNQLIGCEFANWNY